MKRLLAVIIAMSYLCLSIGITVHIHYCMGKIVGSSLIEQDEDHHCAHCGMDKTSSNKGCCKDEHKVYKNTNDQLVSKMLILKAGFNELIFPVTQLNFPSLERFACVYQHFSAQANAPPKRVTNCPLYIRLRNFRV